jgi:hypothetical protein
MDRVMIPKDFYAPDSSQVSGLQAVRLAGAWIIYGFAGPAD